MDENKKISDFKSLNMVLFELDRNLRKRLYTSFTRCAPPRNPECARKKAYLNMFIILHVNRKTLIKLIEQSPDGVDTQPYIEQKDQYERLMLTIYNDVMSISNAVIREILFQTFILGRTTYQTAYEINYSQRQTERLRSQGLKWLKITWTETDEEAWTSYFVTPNTMDDKEV